MLRIAVQVASGKRLFRLSTRGVDKSVHERLPRAAQSAWLHACARLGETLTKQKYMFVINRLQTRFWYIFVLPTNASRARDRWDCGCAQGPKKVVGMGVASTRRPAARYNVQASLRYR